MKIGANLFNNTGVIPVQFSLSAVTKSTFTQGFKLSLGLQDDFDLAEYMCPKDGDFVHVPMRALSACPVQGGLIDFSKPGVLQSAVAMFNGLTVFKDHERSVDMCIGKTSAAYWDDVTPGVPPGVNFMVDVDAKLDPRCARALSTGTIDSGSMTVQFDWEKSHPKLDDEMFWAKFGTEFEGSTVRLVVSKVTRCMEYSVVWQGADQFAKVIGDDGKIVVPGVASHSFSLHVSQETQMNWKELAALLGLTLEGEVTEEQFRAALTAAGLNTTALAQAQVKLTEAQTELTTHTTKLTASEAQVTALNATVAELKPFAELGQTFLKNTRAEALRLYNLVEADKATEPMRSLIGTANLEVAQSFVSSYTPRAEQIAPMKCTKCGSVELSRAAAVPAEVPPVTSFSTSFENERLKTTLASVHGK